MSYWGDDVLRHKYDPLPEDAPRHKKKAKKPHVKADHRHEYETVAIDAHAFVLTRSHERFPYLYVGERCKVCGRLADIRSTSFQEPPEGVDLYEVEDFTQLLGLKALPDDMRKDLTVDADTKG